jgi:hypothetical protein
MNFFTVLYALEIGSPGFRELMRSSYASCAKIYAAFCSSFGFTIRVREAMADISQYFPQTLM